MRGRANGVILTAVFLTTIATTAAHVQDRWRIDVENGAAISGRNDVRIPGTRQRGSP